MAFFEPPPLHGQFLYPERGQKQTFFDLPPPPHLVHVVTEWPLILNNQSSIFLLLSVESLSDLEKLKKLGRGIDTNVTAIYENDSKTATAGTSYVSIILASAAAVFVVLIIAVFFVYKRHKNGYKNKHAKVTMNELESEQFANQMADDEWPNNIETNPELSKFNLSVDAEVDSRPPSFKYIGATSYDIQDNNIIKTQK